VGIRTIFAVITTFYIVERYTYMCIQYTP